jgi:uncharacterized protein
MAIERLFIQQHPIRGRCVIATQPFVKGGLIEVCLVIVVPEIDVKGILDHYVYQWGRGNFAIALGYGSIYNHSKVPNIDWDCNFEGKVIVFRALKNIHSGSELVSDYGYEPKGYDGL